MYKAIAVFFVLAWHNLFAGWRLVNIEVLLVVETASIAGSARNGKDGNGAMLFSELEEELPEEETSFMQVGMSKPVARPRRTGRTMKTVRAFCSRPSRRECTHVHRASTITCFTLWQHSSSRVRDGPASAQMINFILLISRQGKTRLKKWFVPCPERDQFRTIKEVSSLILNRSPKVCNFLEWRDYKLCYKRYASLFFIACIEQNDNELLALETVHHFVECLDRYFGNVCELDLIFNFHKATGIGAITA
eukprot:Skav203170  [mRNA]  locus=scaffold371:307384:322539:+ [translate_table: standard]